MCRFKDVVRNFCCKRGHIQRVCQSRLRQQQFRSPPARSALGKQPYTHKVEEGTEPPASAGVNHPPTTHESLHHEPLPVNYNVFVVETDKEAHPPATQESPPPEPLPVDYNVFGVGTDKKANTYLVTVTVDGATLQMEIDTGSALTLISKATFSKLWPEGQSPRLLVADGILEPVRFSEWAAPIVPVVKRDCSIRVCGDYKLTVSQASCPCGHLPSSPGARHFCIVGQREDIHQARSGSRLPTADPRCRLPTLYYNQHSQRPLPTHPTTLWSGRRAYYLTEDHGVAAGRFAACVYLPR